MGRSETELPAQEVTRDSRIDAMFSRSGPLVAVDESAPFPLFDGGGVFAMWIAVREPHPTSFTVSLIHRRAGAGSGSVIATTTVPAGARNHTVAFADRQVYAGDELTVSLGLGDPGSSPGRGLTVVARVG